MFTTSALPRRSINSCSYMLPVPFARCSAMVVKKLGEELTQEYLDVLEFLGAQQGLKVTICQRACWRHARHYQPLPVGTWQPHSPEAVLQCHLNFLCAAQK